MSDPADSSSPAGGSVEFVVYRLARWAANAPRGVAYVAYDAPNVRATAEARFASAIRASGLTLDRLDLTAFSTVPEALAALEDKIATTESDVLSVTGFAGFLRALGDDWTPLNYRREDWFHPDVRQVWWVPAAYEAAFARRAPDLYSWFLVRERLVGPAPGIVPSPVPTNARRVDPERAAERSEAALARFKNAYSQKADLPALVSLATQAATPLYESGQETQAHDTLSSLLDRLELGKRKSEWADSDQDPATLARKVELAALCMQNADLALAIRLLGPGRETDLEKLPVALRAQAHETLGVASQATAKYGEASKHFAKSLELYEAADLPLGQAHALAGQGDVAFYTGNLHESRSHNERALRLYELAGDELGQSNALRRLGDVAAYLGDLDHALDRYEGAKGLLDTLAYPLNLANIEQNVGELYLARGNLNEAEESYRRSLDACKAINDLLGQANALLGIGKTWIRSGDPPSAQPLLEEAQCLYQAENIPLGEANAIYFLGEIDRDRGRTVDAESKFLEALDRYRALETPDGQAMAHEGLGTLALQEGEKDEALRRFMAAREIYGSMGNPLGQANANDAIARLHALAGRKEEARSDWLAALDLYRVVGDLERIGRTHRQLALLGEGAEREAHLTSAREAWEGAGRTDLLPLLDEVEDDPTEA